MNARARTFGITENPNINAPRNRLVVIDADYLAFPHEETAYIECMCFFCEGHPELVGATYYLHTESLVSAPDVPTR
jgi:hypothetical protein